MRFRQIILWEREKSIESKQKHCIFLVNLSNNGFSSQSYSFIVMLLRIMKFIRYE